MGRFLSPVGDETDLPVPEPAEICPNVANLYLGAISIVQGLAESYGFQACSFWQRITPYEQSARAQER